MTDKEKDQLAAEVKAAHALLKEIDERQKNRIESVKLETQDMKKTFAEIQS